MSPTPRRLPPRPKLRELANRLGIIPEYLDQTGRSVRRTTDVTREVLLSIMGFDAPTEDAARGWLSELDHEAATMILDPVRVVERDDASARRVRIQLPPDMPSARVRVTLTEEAGHVWHVEQEARRVATLQLPTRAPYGYHRLTAELSSTSGDRRAEQTFIVVPERCVTPDMLLKKRKAAGVFANLYSVRREHDWGVGDLCTFMHLVEWASARGLDFVGVNPLHALFNRGTEISPYSPVSRLFRNHIYIDVETVPEWTHSEAARAESSTVTYALHELRKTSLVDYDRVIALKERVLLELYRTFRSRASHGAGAQRAEDFAGFSRLREPELTRFATWMAIAESADAPDWRRWPAELQEPDSEVTRAFGRSQAERIDFHKWLQFETHRQLGDVSQRARVLGMGVGVYQDLAIGTSRGGSDTWSYPELFLTGAAVGAPPDPYAVEGQNWGLPPMDPRVLRQQKYRYWVQLVRRAFEHAGALRIDHVMGLFRTFWIPDGGTGEDGAYVRFPANDMLGILALESVRHDALVVGEDLGTVPKEVPPALKKWGILSSKVLYFERDKRGFRPAKQYAPLSLATANTHDMATLAGFWTERDIELRTEVGLVPASELPTSRAERARDKRQLLEALKLTPPPPYDRGHFTRTLTAAVHEFLCSTPSDLVGLALDDLIGEQEPVNVPGVGPDKYPSWRRRTRLTMEEVAWSFEVDDAIRCRTRRRSKR